MKSNIKNKILYFGLFCASFAILIFLIGGLWIGYEAKRICQEAKWEYFKTDCTQALSMQLDDSNQGYRTRNHAIWAMGQLGDERALPVLEKHFTNVIPEKEPLDQTISQYELKKAISLLNGGVNIISWVWR